MHLLHESGIDVQAHAGLLGGLAVLAAAVTQADGRHVGWGPLALRDDLVATARVK